MTNKNLQIAEPYNKIMINYFAKIMVMVKSMMIIIKLIMFKYFYLSGEDLDGGILNSYILEADEALVLSAIDHFDDDSVKSE